MNKLLLGIWLFLDSSLARAFPDMVRHGYSSCNSCHVSPSGGGVLNSYGRSISSELLSTYRNEKATRYFLPKMPHWLSFGGDIRYLNVNVQSIKTNYHRHFLMQSDYELAVSPVPGLTVAASVGFYDVNFPEKNYRKIEAEQRRNYVLLDIGKFFSIRAGFFRPAYGLNFPDHTLATRKHLGFDEGSETNNIEGNIHTRFGEVFLTGIQGTQGHLINSGTDGYQWRRTSGEYGGAAQINFFSFKRTNVGLSALRVVNKETRYIRTAYGIHGMLAPILPQIYTQFEIDQLIETGKKRETIWVARQGVEIYRGVHFLATYEGIRSSYSAWRYSFQIFPISHLELSAEYQRRVPYPRGVLQESWVFLAHWYF